MLEQFVQTYNEAFRELPSTALWTNDGVVRTSTMQSYIYPWIANALGMYLVCEHPTDAAYFDRSAIIRAAERRVAYPKPSDASVCIEHENDCRGSRHEMEALSKTQALLNVLITYRHATEEEQISWANESYAPVLIDADHCHTGVLVVLPSAEQDRLGGISTESRRVDAKLWRFFLWDKATSSFRTFG